MLSFLPILPLLLLAKSFHFIFPSSSSRFALTFRGSLVGRAGPSLTLLGSLRAWLASAGLMSAAAEITLGCGGAGEGDAELPDVPSALRLRESLPEMGRMSLAVKVSTVEYDLNETIYTGLLDEPVMEVMRAG